MLQTISLAPGITLRHFYDTRFKQGRLSLQLLQPMDRQTAAMNALIPAVLLRGTRHHPDMRSITQHLDTLYGASMSDIVRRDGDYQAIGFVCGFTEDRFALPGDQILAPAAEFLREILLEPALENGCFNEKFVSREKEVRISDIEAIYDDKPHYAANQLMTRMCSGDSFGIPRLGTVEQVSAITAEALYRQYRHLLQTSPMELFYVGSAPVEQVSALLQPLLKLPRRAVLQLPPQAPFQDAGSCHETCTIDTAQSILTVGFVTPITASHPSHAAMRVLNMLFGAGMTGKLFQNVRERLSLCYSIGSEYYGSKGLLTVMAGIDSHQEETVRQEIRNQLDACRRGDISHQELHSAKAAICSALQTVHDSPGAIENYYTAQARAGGYPSTDAYRKALEAVTIQDVVSAAKTLQEHSSYFLKGVGQ